MCSVSLLFGGDAAATRLLSLFTVQQEEDKCIAVTYDGAWRRRHEVTQTPTSDNPVDGFQAVHKYHYRFKYDLPCLLRGMAHHMISTNEPVSLHVDLGDLESRTQDIGRRERRRERERETTARVKMLKKSHGFKS